MSGTIQDSWSDRMSERAALLSRMSTALYEWSTTRTNATWEGKRSGLVCPSPSGVHWKSCGAFRDWAIHCHDGRACFSMRGFDYRDRSSRSGGVGVLVGDGEFVFPWNDSRSHHSLSLTASNGSHIVWVTGDPDVEWEPRIEVMADSLECALNELVKRVSDFDICAEALRRETIAQQKSAAKAALAGP